MLLQNQQQVIIVVLDLLSNGFKFRTGSSGPLNGITNTFIMAFGQTLVGSNNIPCTAR